MRQRHDNILFDLYSGAYLLVLRHPDPQAEARQPGEQASARGRAAVRLAAGALAIALLGLLLGVLPGGLSP